MIKLVAITLFAATAGWFLTYLQYKDLRRAYLIGVVSAKGGSYDRRKSPIYFWITVVLSAFALLVGIVFGLGSLVFWR